MRDWTQEEILLSQQGKLKESSGNNKNNRSSYLYEGVSSEMGKKGVKGHKERGRAALAGQREGWNQREEEQRPALGA